MVVPKLGGRAAPGCDILASNRTAAPSMARRTRESPNSSDESVGASLDTSGAPVLMGASRATSGRAGRTCTATDAGRAFIATAVVVKHSRRAPTVLKRRPKRENNRFGHTADSSVRALCRMVTRRVVVWCRDGAPLDLQRKWHQEQRARCSSRAATVAH